MTLEALLKLPSLYRYELKHASHISKLPKGKHSVKGNVFRKLLLQIPRTAQGGGFLSPKIIVSVASCYKFVFFFNV